MLEESVCDRAAYVTGNSHNYKHVCGPFQVEFSVDELGCMKMDDSLFH